MFDAAAVTAALNAASGTLMPGAGGVGVGAPVPASQVQDANLTRQARRLYVGNLPTGMGLTDQYLLEFFTTVCKQIGVQTVSPVLSVWTSSEGTFCFVEMRAVQDATSCLALMQTLTLAGRILKVGRPADYKPLLPAYYAFVVGQPAGTYVPIQPPAGLLGLTGMGMQGMMPGLAGLGMNALVVNPLTVPVLGGMAGVQAMVAATGTPGALQGALNGIPAATTPTLTAAAPVAATPEAATPATTTTTDATATTEEAPATAATSESTATKDDDDDASMEKTNVLMLLNMVTPEELKDDEEFGDIVLDVREECEKYGVVESIVIPRPPKGDGAAEVDAKTLVDNENDKGPISEGVGRIFVLFKDISGCEKARDVLHKRMFSNNTVQATYYDVEAFQSNKFLC